MSSYNEDWQRKKAYLIRSLFHDIPYRVLSPVTEESTQSSYKQREDYTQTSNSEDSHQYSSFYEESEGVTLSESTGSLEAPRHYVGPTPETGLYSDLPPLIIERMPNKHDEPREFYKNLLLKMRRIYKKMFLETKTFDDHEDNSKMDDSVLNKESFSLNSNGYNADLESPDSYESNIVEPYAPEIPHNVEDGIINLIDYDNNMISNDHTNIDNDSEDDENSDVEMEPESSGNEDPTYSQITFKADIHIDGRPLPAVEPSPIYERPQIEITPVPVNILIEEKEGRLSENSSRDVTQNSQISTSSSSSPTPMHLESHSEETLSSECTKQQFEMIIKQSHIDFMRSNEKSKLEITQMLVSEPQFVYAQGSMDVDPILSPVLTTRSQCQRPKGSEKDLAIAWNDNQELTRTQITANAKVNTEASYCDDGKSKQDSAFVLRFRRSGERSLLVGRDSSILENIQDPEISPSTEENDDHTKELEVMRTPRVDISAESVQTGTNRLSNHIDDNNNCEHNMAVEDISNETVESLDDRQIGTNQPKVSGDIDDILATIFDKSQEADEQSINYRDTLNSSRKRCYEEISVQTDNVSWNDIRANFFVGRPKIFRLCSCVGHHCV